MVMQEPAASAEKPKAAVDEQWCVCDFCLCDGRPKLLRPRFHWHHRRQGEAWARAARGNESWVKAVGLLFRKTSLQKGCLGQVRTWRGVDVNASWKNPSDSQDPGAGPSAVAKPKAHARKACKHIPPVLGVNQ